MLIIIVLLIFYIMKDIINMYRNNIYIIKYKQQKNYIYFKRLRIYIFINMYLKI